MTDQGVPTPRPLSAEPLTEEERDFRRDAAMRRYQTGERPNLPAIRLGEPGHVLLVPGDPRYCWNPYRHDPHEFYYTLDDGLTGHYECRGDAARAAITPEAGLREAAMAYLLMVKAHYERRASWADVADADATLRAALRVTPVEGEAGALALLREGMAFIGADPDRSRELDHRPWRVKVEEYLAALSPEEPRS